MGASSRSPRVGEVMGGGIAWESGRGKGIGRPCVHGDRCKCLLTNPKYT